LVLKLICWPTALVALALAVTRDWHREAWSGVIYLATAGVMVVQGSQKAATSWWGAAAAVALGAVILVSLALHGFDVW
jgi:hypothetical protein